MAAENSRFPRPAHPGGVASMRPRRMAAENDRAASVNRIRRRGFNEAAAHGRGKRGLQPGRRRRAVASMRPRRMAAENVNRISGSGPRKHTLQ